MRNSRSISRERIKSIIIVIICTLLTAIAQVLLKYATISMAAHNPIYTNLPLIAGLLTYALASVLLIIALRGADLSLIYPFISLSFVWVTLLSIFLFREFVSTANIFGVTAIIVGVSLIGRGGRT